VLEAVAAEGRWIGTEVPFDRTARAKEQRDRLHDAATFAGFVAEADGKVIGSIGLHLAPYGVVHLGMALLEAYRGQGIGSRLLARGLEWASDSGAHKVALEVWPHNEAAIALYKKAGFEEEGWLRRHYRRRSGECWDAVVMGLLLERGGAPSPGG
jgi:RimJ/RimL family protein N-acetyltransferase